MALAIVVVSLALIPVGSDPAEARRDPPPPGGPLPGLTAEQLALFEAGREVFLHEFTAEEGLGPIYNERACQTCHGGLDGLAGGPDATGVGSIFNVTHFGLDQFGLYNALRPLGGPVIQHRAIRDTTHPDCPIAGETLPPFATVVSIRHTPAVWGFGLVDAIPDRNILRNQSLNRDGIHGFANWGREMQGRAMAGTITDPQFAIYGSARVGRFGWKAQTGTLEQFSADPFNIELGVTNQFFPQEFTPTGLRLGPDLPPECQVANHPVNDFDQTQSFALYHFQALLAPPEPLRATWESRRGEAQFHRIGCDNCHVPRTRTNREYWMDVDGERAIRVQALENQWVNAYSDFLVHDMGDALADNGGTTVGRVMGRANGRQWRTTPLWGLRFKSALLHDGRTADVREAILAHGGEAQNTRDRFAALSASEQAWVVAFLQRL
ncbi:MAG: hypothetical protein K8H88_22790 [Sandaracinaceae bacterium]|nr:hypothetical protein [Sandaracinaceae bacterium]